MIPVLYEGTADPHSPLWPGFFCRGGAYDGESCDPMMIGECGADAQCATSADSSVACIGYGPGDGGFGLSAAGISITQQTAEEFFYADGVYGELPLKGMILWNSHAFNLTDSAGRLEAWLNFEFAQPQEQVAPAQDIYDVTAVMATNAPAFGTDEPCAIALLPQHAHLFDLSSHTHKRGKRFRAFLGAFQCQGGPASGAACSPLGYDFVSRDTCQGAPCVAMMHPRTGDCDLNQRVTIDELVTSVIIALDKAPLSECDDIDIDENNRVQMNELVTAVGASLHGVPPATQRDPEESLIYVNLIYNDPLVLRMDDDPLIFNSPIADQRALTYCSLYDNGYTNPEEVKRRSTSPEPPNNFFLGGPCKIPTGCTQGKVTADCSGGPLEERNRSCDSSDGAGDGLCDACPLVGGVTTEDEMFVLLGHYFIR